MLLVLLVLLVLRPQKNACISKTRFFPPMSRQLNKAMRHEDPIAAHALTELQVRGLFETILFHTQTAKLFV